MQKSGMVNLRISPELHEALARESKIKDISLNKLISGKLKKTTMCSKPDFVWDLKRVSVQGDFAIFNLEPTEITLTRDSPMPGEICIMGKIPESYLKFFNQGDSFDFLPFFKSDKSLASFSDFLNELYSKNILIPIIGDDCIVDCDFRHFKRENDGLLISYSEQKSYQDPRYSVGIILDLPMTNQDMQDAELASERLNEPEKRFSHEEIKEGVDLKE